LEKLEIGMKIAWIRLPWRKASRGSQSFHEVSVVDVSECGKYIKLRGRISFGGIRSDWYSKADIIKLNYEKGILEKFKR